MEEDDAEDEQASHHGEHTGVVWVSRGNVALILGVLQWAHGHLRHGVKIIRTHAFSEGREAAARKTKASTCVEE